MPGSQPPPDLARFREKIDRELKSGVVTILLLLAIDRAGPDYGYRLLRSLGAWTGGRLAIQEGTAYPLLQNLERLGLVTSFWGDGEGGPRRRYYQITDYGKRALDVGLEEYSDLVDTVSRTIRALDKEAKT